MNMDKMSKSDDLSFQLSPFTKLTETGYRIIYIFLLKQAQAIIEMLLQI